MRRDSCLSKKEPVFEYRPVYGDRPIVQQPELASLQQEVLLDQPQNQANAEAYCISC
jgi:hypothetical protein